MIPSRKSQTGIRADDGNKLIKKGFSIVMELTHHINKLLYRIHQTHGSAADLRAIPRC
jgi:hypothetical protein